MFSDRFRRVPGVCAALLAAMFISGCGDSGKPATIGSTELYMQAFLKRMEKFGPVQVWSDGRRTVGHGMARTLYFTVPAKNFPIDRLGGEMAATFQGMNEGYKGVTAEGGKSEYGFQYGDNHTGAFIDGQATLDGEKVQVRMAVRVVE